MNSKINSFKDLHVWQKSHSLVLIIYRVTKGFPSNEIYGLTNQLRRAAISITSNIAEGFYRQSRKEKIQFYSITIGSIGEVENQIIIARDLGYINQKESEKILSGLNEVLKMMNALIKSIRKSSP